MPDVQTSCNAHLIESIKNSESFNFIQQQKDSGKIYLFS